MNIIANRKKFFAVSILIIAIGFVFMAINGTSGKGALNFDIEFTGGTSMRIDVGEPFEAADVEKIISDATQQKAPQIQKVTDSNEVLIKIQSVPSETRSAIMDAVTEKYPNAVFLDIADVSGTISSEMQRSAIIATLLACAAMLAYISVRFKDARMGVSAILTLAHDVLVVIAFYAILRVPVNNSFIAALLTVLGYSINATIVIFDRIRENNGKYRKYQLEEKINASVSQTIGRSINTSITTLFTIGAIYLLGVQSIKEFALPIIIGIISGAYSSVFLAGSIWYMILPASEKN